MNLRRFLAAAPGARRDWINMEELYRSILASVGAMSFSGLCLTVLGAILSHADAIFPDPVAGALATAFLTLVVDLIRRSKQGGPTPPEPPADAPAARIAA